MIYNFNYLRSLPEVFLLLSHNKLTVFFTPLVIDCEGGDGGGGAGG